MPDHTVSIAEAKARLSALVSAAEAGDEVVITRRGEPVVRLVAQRRRKRPDVDRMRRLAAQLPREDEDSGSLVGRLRDSASY